VSLAAALALYFAFRLVEQYGALSWSTVSGEGLLKVLVWVVPSIVVVMAAYRISLPKALEELGLWSNPLVGYGFGLVSALPTLLPATTAVAALSGTRLLADVVLGPFAEEVLFRGLFFRQLHRRAGRRPLRAMAVSALVFGFAHLTNVVGPLDAPQAASQAAALVGTATLGGLLFAWLAYRWDSIWPAVGLHSFLNLSWDATTTTPTNLVTTMRLAAVVVALVLTWRFTRRARPGQLS
jgi:membrane protease YdiL (CAAX protease family)